MMSSIAPIRQLLPLSGSSDKLRGDKKIADDAHDPIEHLLGVERGSGHASDMGEYFRTVILYSIIWVGGIGLSIFRVSWG